MNCTNKHSRTDTLTYITTDMKDQRNKNNTTYITDDFKSHSGTHAHASLTLSPSLIGNGECMHMHHKESAVVLDQRCEYHT